MGFWKSVKKGAWTDPLDKASPTIKAELGKVYRFLLFVDFVIITFVKVRLPLRFVRVLICDRYVYDLIMELALSDLYSEVFAKLIFTTSPHPQRVFFADAPIEVIGRRRPELTKDHIYRKQDFYRKLANIFEFWTFDTSEPFESNQLHLQKEIFLLLEGVS
jgi:dTMP kinase